MVIGQPAPEISGYEILGGLGEGGMGAVFLARDQVLGRRVAIKVVSGKIAGDPQARDRFLREARTLATVEHPNVVRVYAFGELERGAYLILEYIEGETLADRIAREGPLPVDENVRILRQIIEALDAAHEHGIVHRDIKPSNILIGRRDDIRVADFGLAKPTSLGGEGSETLTQTGYMLGTPHYVSPEQALGKTIDFRTDVYSLGIVFYEMLTAERPFQGTTPMAIVAKSLHEPLPDIRTRRPDLPQHLVDLLEWMTRKESTERPSYAELKEALDEGAPKTRPMKRRSPRRGRDLVVMTTAIILGVAIGIGSYLTFGAPEAEIVPDARPSEEMVIAVAPFWGPDDLSSREGRVMAALVERSIESRLGSDVRITGIDETNDPVRSHEAARELGRRLEADVVVWGEALALRDETEIQPSFTLVDLAKPVEGEQKNETEKDELSSMEDLEAIERARERGSQPLRLFSDAPDQIEMRRTSAEGVGEMVTFLAALHHLYVRDDPKSSLPFLRRSTRSADVLHHEARALVQLEREDEAIASLRQALEYDPEHAKTHAQLADLLWMREDRHAAKEHYLLAAATGEPPETVQAIIHEGRLFARELWETDTGDTRHSGYLLVIDPESDRVLERHFMPGEIESLRSSEGVLTITWTDRGLDDSYTLTWRAGTFDPPICCYGGNLLRRMHGVKSGREVGRNFTRGVFVRLEDQEAHPRYALPEDPDAINPAKPASLEELEAFLVPAMERDPTQPWYRVHLGFVQNATDRAEEAEQTWSSIFERDWPGVPYWEFTWMSRLFERVGEREWADRFFERAMEVRLENPQPVEWSLLIERLIVAQFVRMHEVHLDDPERAYEWLLRARQLTGSTEGSRMVAAVWEEWFERQGDEVRARHEEEFSETAFDWMTQMARIDYLLYAIFVLSLATPLLSMMFLWSAWRRTRKTISQSPPHDIRGSEGAFVASATVVAVAAAGTLYLSLIRPQEEALAAILFGLLCFWVALLGGVFWRRKAGSLPNVSFAELVVLSAAVGGLIGAGGPWGGPRPLVIALVSAVVLVASIALHRRGLRWRDLAGQIAKRERLAMVAMTIVLVSVFGFFAVELAGTARTWVMNVGVTDSLGHPQQTTYFERLLARVESPELVYLTAVSNHLSRNFARAISLYERLPEDERAVSGLTAAREGRVEVVLPSGFEMMEAVRTDAWRDLPLTTERLYDDDLAFFYRASAALVIAMLLLCVLVLAVRPQRHPGHDHPGRAAVVAGLIVPSYWSLRRGKTFRGTIALTLLVFVLILGIMLPRTLPVYGSPGIVGAIAMPNLFNAFPVPLPGDLTRADAPEVYRYALMFSYWGAGVFWLVALLGSSTLVVLHVLTVRDILRFRRTDSAEAETEITPVPASGGSLTVEDETIVKEL